ncbi:MAG: hypothetical protein NVS3B23_07950 [Candidatus Saccharimonadales bacterium]
MQPTQPEPHNLSDQSVSPQIPIQPVIIQPSLPQQPAMISATDQTAKTNSIQGKRIGAAIVDLLLIFFVLSLTGQGGFIMLKLSSTGYAIVTGPGVYLYGLKGLITVICITLYFVVFETIKGATIGKMAAGITVVQVDGSKTTFKKALLRNVVRLVDGFPYVIPYVLGMIIMAVTKKHQRIGDKIAGTIVVTKH